MASGRRVSDASRSLKGLQLECAKVLHKTLLVPVLMYDNDMEGRRENYD